MGKRLDTTHPWDTQGKWEYFLNDLPNHMISSNIYHKKNNPMQKALESFPLHMSPLVFFKHNNYFLTAWREQSALKSSPKSSTSNLPTETAHANSLTIPSRMWVIQTAPAPNAWKPICKLSMSSRRSKSWEKKKSSPIYKEEAAPEPSRINRPEASVGTLPIKIKALPK